MDAKTMQEIAEFIHSKTEGKLGFSLIVYEHDTQNGRLNYISNSNREDVVRAMKRFISKTEDHWGTHQYEN